MQRETMMLPLGLHPPFAPRRTTPFAQNLDKVAALAADKSSLGAPLTYT